MQRSALDRRLFAVVLLLFFVPTAAVGVVLALLYRAGLYPERPIPLLVTGVVGLAAVLAYLGAVTHLLARSLVRTLEEIRLGTELIGTVNPDHRVAVRTGDEFQALAEEVNRLADRLGDARRGLADEVARATRELAAEREALARVLAALGDGALLATLEGRVSLANQAAQALLGPDLLGRNLFDLVDREKVTLFLERLRTRASAAERFTLEPAGGGVLDTVMTPLADGQGRLNGFVLLLRDVTRPVRLDEVRRRLLGEALREIRDRVASVRSLSETLLADPGLTGDTRRVLDAIQVEAVRLSGVVRRLDGPAGLGLGISTLLEEVSVADLTAMVQRRLEREGAGSIAFEAPPGEAPPAIRAEASALSETLAQLARAVLLRRVAGRHAWIRAATRGRVVQIDVGAEGGGAVADLDPLLDAAQKGAPGRPLREVVHRHAGEAWAYADGDRVGFRITLPVAEPEAPAEGEEPRAAPPRVAFVGAGTASAGGAWREEPERPEFYDFSLLEEAARDLAPGTRDRPLDLLDYVVFDTETTGLSPETGDRIVSIAGVRVRAGVVRRGETFDALVNPGRGVPAGSTRFHGITDAMVEDAPPLDVVLPAFLRFAGGAVLAGHEVSFDLHFLALESRRLGLPPLPAGRGVLDTLLLSEVVHGPLERHGLNAVAERLGVVIRGRHSALGDALATAEVLLRLVELLKRRGIRTFGEATDAMRRVRRGLAGGPGR